MSRQLEDITLYYNSDGDDAKQFTLRQNVVSDLYMQYLNSYKPPKTSRISVHLEREDYILGYFGSILSAKAKFDKEKYMLLKSDGQNRLILETVHRIALMCAAKYDWDIERFREEYREVLNVNFKFRIESKSKSSKDKKHKASIILEKDLTSSKISAIFYNQAGDAIKKVQLLRSFQHKMFYGRIIKKYKWFNNQEFGLYTTDDELTIRASLLSDEPTTSINPTKTDKKRLEGYLNYITYQEINSQQEFVKWANK